MSPEGWLRKASKFSEGTARQSADAVPEGLAVKCARCGEILFKREFERNLKVCAKCGHHHRLTAAERIVFTADEDSFKEFATDLISEDPLEFPGYQKKLEAGWEKTGRADAFRVGTAKVDGQPCILGVSEFGFRGGSMGSVMGEKITRALEYGCESKLPVVLFTSSGGARMEEGLISLMQMAKTSAAVSRYSKMALPFIVVLADPTIGGVPASFASLGDVLLSEPGALIALSGERVAAQAQTQKVPADYQTAEWRMAHGQLDAVVPRREMRATLARLLGLLYSAERYPASKPAVSRNGKANGNGHKRQTEIKATTQEPDAKA
ncbi:MAG TPA: acetyl-CoA carboxylase, carboxyltransferase subunit beta [Capsulimonadaceae bacterium]|nr:acetyl-CoA carboxylase, carboxyltransferase subunit beta [Capsulimonadaceae bacterium]